MLTRISLAGWMLIAILLGLVYGVAFPDQAQALSIVSTIFLRLIRSVIAPVLFGVLVTAAGRAENPRELGRVAWKAVAYFEVVTAIALLIGWTAVLIVRPGDSLHIGTASQSEVAQIAAKAPGIAEIIANAFPTSVFDAMARGDILQIVIFTGLFAAACAGVGERAGTVVTFAESLTAIAFQYTRYIMYVAPLAVFAAIASTVAVNGSAALGGLAKFVATAWAAQIFFGVTVFGLSLWIARLPVTRFLRYARDPFLVGFATTSSAAALPQTLESLIRMGVPQRIVGLVTPLSLTLNMTGSCVHLAMGALFTAQAAGISLTLAQQVAILATLKLTSKGVAGIPRANLVILTGLFATFGFPAEAVTILLGIDALIDPVRTGVNVLGHTVAAPVIARWETEPELRILDTTPTARY